MILKYVSKFVLDVMPSIVATVIGAYIVTHYVNSKPAAEAPKAAIVSAPDAAPAEPSPKAPAAEATPQQAETGAPATRPAAAPAEKRHQIVTRDKPAAKAVATALAPAGGSAIVEERKDANDLARAAIERLRGPVTATANQDSARAPDLSRPQEPARAVNQTFAAPAPPQVATASANVSAVAPPLPPALSIPARTVSQIPASGGSASDAAVRPIPPADIPARDMPLDIRSASAEPANASVTADVFSAVRSVFRAVTPH